MPNVPQHQPGPSGIRNHRRKAENVPLQEDSSDDEDLIVLKDVVPSFNAGREMVALRRSTRQPVEVSIYLV